MARTKKLSAKKIRCGGRDKKSEVKQDSETDKFAFMKDWHSPRAYELTKQSMGYPNFLSAEKSGEEKEKAEILEFGAYLLALFGYKPIDYYLYDPELTKEDMELLMYVAIVVQSVNSEVRRALISYADRRLQNHLKVFLSGTLEANKLLADLAVSENLVVEHKCCGHCHAENKSDNMGEEDHKCCGRCKEKTRDKPLGRSEELHQKFAKQGLPLPISLFSDVSDTVEEKSGKKGKNLLVTPDILKQQKDYQESGGQQKSIFNKEVQELVDMKAQKTAGRFRAWIERKNHR